MSKDLNESPFIRLIGATIEDWRDGFVRLDLQLRPEHLNRSGVVHGGLLSTLLDHAAGLSCLFCPEPGRRRNGMTLTLTTTYVAQARTGRVMVVGERVKAGRSIFFARSEARADDGTLLATATGAYKFRRGSEAPEGVSVPD